MGFVFRLVPFRIATIDELDLPQILKELVVKPRGLILVTGPTGSGKSTTLAAMIDYLNQNAARSVITIEDPLSFYTKMRSVSLFSVTWATIHRVLLRVNPFAAPRSQCDCRRRNA